MLNKLKSKPRKVKRSGQYDKLGNSYTKELEQKVTAGMDAAKAKL
ncbi:MAG: hypothetical protein CM15mV53_130 [uncultured marine virus]|nr:MAG: hypothetical protein CM15mV53_130 [uncultured marine virus]